MCMPSLAVAGDVAADDPVRRRRRVARHGPDDVDALARRDDDAQAGDVRRDADERASGRAARPRRPASAASQASWTRARR